MRQPVDAKIDVRESYCRINKICWNFPPPPPLGGGRGGRGGTKHKHKQTSYSAAFHTNFREVKEFFFFFFLGFTQSIKITKIQLSGEEEEKKKTVRYSLGEFEIMRVTITYDSSI